MRLPDPSLPWAIPMPAVALIAEAEGCRLKAYKCPAGVWTIGWGHTRSVRPGMTCTQAEADRWLCDDIGEAAAAVATLCTDPPEPNQLGAMVSLVFNIGAEAFRKSTVLRAHNAGDPQAAARAFSLWDKARVGGVRQSLPGLTARRAAEAALYLKPDDEAPRQQMPQAVEAETTLTASPIARGAVVTAGTGAASLATEFADYLGPVKGALDAARDLLANTLGLPSRLVLPLLLVGVGWVVWKNRRDQRRNGWA